MIGNRKMKMAMIAAVAALICACGGFQVPADGTKTVAEARRESDVAMETNVEKEGLSPDTELQEESPGERMPKTRDSGNEKISCLSMDKVLELADREELSWTDLEDYESRDTGFGLMILVYDIDKDFYLAAGGTGFDKEPLYIRLVWAKGEDYIDIRQESSDKVKDFLEKYRSGTEQVGIRAHVKELHGDKALLSSDTDDFPGVFWVLGVSELTAEGELQGGKPVFVLMEDMEMTAEDGIAKYRAKEIYVDAEEKEEQEKVLLTSPPAMKLSDPKSSSLTSSFQVLPGNYSWNMATGQGTVACGFGPLDDAAMKSAARLKIPQYNGVDKILYSCFLTVWPDKITVRQWDESDMGNAEAEEEWSAVCYYRMPFIELEKGKVYEFWAEWKQANGEKNGFWGNAGYVFVTE